MGIKGGQCAPRPVTMDLFHRCGIATIESNLPPGSCVPQTVPMTQTLNLFKSLSINYSSIHIFEEFQKFMLLAFYKVGPHVGPFCVTF